MGLLRLARAARRAATPLSAALVVAALGVTTALLVLAMRGHFSAAASRGVLGGLPTPPGQAAPAAPTPSLAVPSSSSPTAPPTGPQSIAGVVADTVTIPLSSDNADNVTIQSGTPISGSSVDQGGQQTVIDVVIGQQPVSKNGKHKRDFSGSAATTTTFSVTTPAGSLTLTIVQDSAVRGTTDESFALEITRPGQ